MKIFPVILAGGSGTRFWPLSRESMPKQFIHLFGDKSLFHQTVERIPKQDVEQIIVVTTPELANVLRKFSYSDQFVILEEPYARSTAPAIGFATAYIKKKFGYGVVAVLPSDHYIPDISEYQRFFSKAVDVALGNNLVTFGVVPQYPETGYGYIEFDDTNIDNSKSVSDAVRFVEKPDKPTAQHYLEKGNFLWNSGIFFFNTDFIWKEYARELPNQHRMFSQFVAQPDLVLSQKIVSSGFRALKKISFDYGIAEKSKNIKVIKINFAWSDMGSYLALLKFSKTSDFILGEGIAAIDTSDCVIINRTTKNKPVVVSGVKGVVVVRMDDVVYVTGVKESQQTGNVVKILSKDSEFMKYLS